jgi:Ca2+-binding EF-hand superfamily protein
MHVYVPKIMTRGIAVLATVVVATVDPNQHSHFIEDFKTYDLDKNGLIDPQEIRTVYHGTLKEEDLKSFWDAVDVNNNGFFTLEEYIEYALKHQEL